MATTRKPYRVELHSHGFDGEVVDLTEFVKRLSYSEGVEPPYGSIEVTLQLARHHVNFVPGRADVVAWPGDWIVIRVGEKAEALGFVTNVQGGLQALGSGAVSQPPTRIMAVSWFDYLGLQNFIIAPTYTGDSIATLFGMKDWGKLYEDVLQSLQQEEALTGRTYRSPGPALEKLVKKIARGTLPDSLGGERLDQAVKVVWSDDTARIWAPDRQVETIPGLHITSLKSLSPRAMDSTPLSMIIGSFLPDKGMVELFPSLEDADPEEGTREVTQERRIRGQAVERTAELQRQDNIARFQQTGKLEDFPLDTDPGLGITGPERPFPSLLESELGRNLGRYPVLVYRMKPWRPKSLLQWAEDEASPIFREDLPGKGAAKFFLLDNTFVDVTWNPRDPRQTFGVESSRIYNVNYGLSFQNDVTATTSTAPMFPENQIEFVSKMGLPFVARQLDAVKQGAAEQVGIRLYKPTWWFLGSETAQDNPKSIVRLLRTVAAQAMQFHGGGAKFLSGSVRFNPPTLFRRAQAGKIVRIGFGPNDRRSTMIAYAERVERRVEVTPKGAIHEEMVVQFTRGLFDESLRSTPFRHHSEVSFE